MSKPLILYVEDDDFSRDIMELMFDDYDEYDLIMFADSRDFEARLLDVSDELAIILLDIHMLPYDGFAMIDMIRKHQRFDDIPILALTASVMNEEITKLRSSGFTGAIAKPIDQDYFSDHLRDVLNGKLVWTVSK